MTLYVGRHMIAMDQKRDEKYQPVEPAEWTPADPKGEAHVEFEILSIGPTVMDNDAETLSVLLKKVR